MLTEYALRGLQAMPEVRVHGPLRPEQRCGVIAFSVSRDGEPQDAHLIAQLLDDEGIAVRAGGHCAYPLTAQLGVAGTVRASFYVYNTLAEVDRLLVTLQDIIQHALL